MSFRRSSSFLGVARIASAAVASTGACRASAPPPPPPAARELRLESSNIERKDDGGSAACALCHAEKSVEQVVSTMEGWWNKRYDRRALRDLYGEDLTVSPLRAALGGKPHEQLLASAILAELGKKDDALRLVPVRASTRSFAPGRAKPSDACSAPLGVDLDAAPEAVAAAASIVIEKSLDVRAKSGSDRGRSISPSSGE